MYKSKLLEETYKNHGLDFVIDNVNHLYIYNFSINVFQSYYIAYYIDQLNQRQIGNNTIDQSGDYKYNGKSIIVNKGLKEFIYNDIYEILLWYNYYKFTRRHILSHDYLGKINGPVNTSYFSRIPHFYRNLDSKKGLHIIKQVLDQVIVENNGLPKYYDPRILDVLFKKSYDCPENSKNRSNNVTNESM